MNASQPSSLSLLLTIALLLPTSAPAQQGEPSGLGVGELTVLRSPQFRQRFLESYIAETDIEPPTTEDEKEAMYRIYELMAADKTDEAVAVIEQWRKGAGSAAFDFMAGSIHFQRNENNQAVTAFKRAVTRHPKFRRAWTNLAQVHVRQGRFDEAALEFAKVIELGGGSSITYGLLGVAHARTGDYIAAESAFRMATLLDPLTRDWKIGLAECYHRQQRHADAAALFEVLLQTQPDRADLWLAQGEAFVRMNQPLKAAANFEIVDRLGGASADTLNNLGDLYANEQMFDLATGAYLRALQRFPDARPERALRAAKFLASREALDDVAALVAAIGKDPAGQLTDKDRIDLLRLRARLALAEGGTEAEAKVLLEVVALDPLDGQALLQLGKFEHGQNRHAEAILFYERAATLEAFEADARVRHAQVLVSQGKYADALPLLRRAQQLKHRENVQQFLDQVEKVAASR